MRKLKIPNGCRCVTRPVGNIGTGSGANGRFTEVVTLRARASPEVGLEWRSRIRWAIWRASTQVKTWTRMLCSVQWCIGENDTTCGSLSWRKEN
jgi:hypothetical protein